MGRRDRQEGVQWLSLELGPLPTISLRWVSQHQVHRDFHGHQPLRETDFFVAGALAGAGAGVSDIDAGGICREAGFCACFVGAGD